MFTNNSGLFCQLSRYTKNQWDITCKTRTENTVLFAAPWGQLLPNWWPGRLRLFCHIMILIVNKTHCLKHLISPIHQHWSHHQWFILAFLGWLWRTLDVVGIPVHAQVIYFLDFKTGINLLNQWPYKGQKSVAKTSFQNCLLYKPVANMIT